MLKIKGLKKKKKGKKNKHAESELFEPGELEEYRKEQARKAEELKAQGIEQEESEEWQKFKALTSGVDDILKKTQGDLDRIKEKSFYQKKPPGPSQDTSGPKKEEKAAPPQQASSSSNDNPVKEKRWVGFEEGDNSLEPPSIEETPFSELSHPEIVEEEVPAQEEEEESDDDEADDADDLFDTSYVEAVATGQIQLAYIPESPQEEEQPEFDPFDTSIVDKVIDPKLQNLTKFSLGSAVEVLTGKASESKRENTGLSAVGSTKRRRPRPQDLLLGSFDESTGTESNETIPVEPAPKSILDEDPLFEEATSEIIGYPPPVTPIVDAVRPVSEIQPLTPKTEKNPKSDHSIDLKTLVEEFVSLPSPSGAVEPLVAPSNVALVNAVEDDFDDEFAALAAESFTKTKETKSKPPRPALPKKEGIEIDSQREGEDEDEEEEEGDDPFDTSFAAQILPGKFELKLIEKEILQETEVIVPQNLVQNTLNKVLKNSDLSINLPGEIKPLTPSQRDLLGGSTTDLSKIGHNPIEPSLAGTLDHSDNTQYQDPFDTSVIDVLVAPKKAELKFLEKEFLVSGSKKTVEVPNDDDFDPREGEENPVALNRPASLQIDQKRQSVPKVVAFVDIKEDLLTTNPEEEEVVKSQVKPLTPYYPEANLVDDGDIDPFDTSHVTNLPGKVELKLIENEFIKNEELKRSISDPEFDPRVNDIKIVPQTTQGLAGQSKDILSEDNIETIKLHTPVVPRRIEDDLTTRGDEDEVDPFDTSIVSTLVPGKQEIKYLEKELIESSCEEIKPKQDPNSTVRQLLDKVPKPSTTSTDLLSGAAEDVDTVKPLTPQPINLSDDEDNLGNIDPFDTSCVANILPGKTELKYLESELLN